MTGLEIPLIGLAAALVVGLTAIATAWVEKSVGTAAVGAMVEKPELFGKCLVVIVIPETIVIFGVVIAIIILGMVPA